MANIDIKAGLGRTTATGPGPAALPDVQVERRQPIDVAQAASQLEGLRRYGGYGNYSPQGSGYGGGMAHGLPGVGGRPYIPPTGHSGGGGIWGQAPMQAQGLAGSGGRRRDLSRSPYGTSQGSSGMDVMFGGTFGGPSFLGESLVDQQQKQEQLRQLLPVKRAGF